MPLMDQVTKIRARIAELHAERADLMDLPVTRDEFHARAEAWVDRQADAYGDDLAYMLSSFRRARPEPLVPNDTTRALTARGRAHAQFDGHSEVDLSPMLCFLLRDEIKRRFAAAIETTPYREGLPVADRPAALARVAAELDAAELAEEALICRADAAGMAIPRREDVRPEIVLAPQPPEEAPAP